MSQPSMQPAPPKPAFLTAFTLVDASMTSVHAAKLLRLSRESRGRHVIVRSSFTGNLHFRLFETVAFLELVLERSKSTFAGLHAPIEELLGSAMAGSSTVLEQNPMAPGAVVLHEGNPVGFFPPDARAVAGPDADERIDHLLAKVLEARQVIDFDSAWTTDARGFDIDSVIGGSLPSIGAPDAWRGLDDSQQVSRIGPASAPPGLGMGKVVIHQDRVPFNVRSEHAPGAVPAVHIQPPTAPSHASTGEEPRFFNAQTPDRVALNAETYVIVQVASEAVQSGAGTAAAHDSIRGFIGELTIDVHAPALKAQGPTTLTLQVPAKGPSLSIRFGFVAASPGNHPIHVMAWNGSAQVAGVTLQIAVDVAPSTIGANAAAGDMDMREPDAGEYTLDVSFEKDTQRYRFQLRSDQKDVWPPMFSEPLLNDAQYTYNQTLVPLNAQARNLYGLSSENQATWLRGMGTLLFEQLVPEKLKALLLERRDAIRVLNILSEGNATPWELLFISDPETGKGDFLSTSTTIARWRYGAGPSRSLSRAAKAVVLPSDAPAEAKVELRRLQTQLGGADEVADITSLNKLLDGGNFDLLHFAAHNVAVPNALGGSYVPFGTQRWDIAQFAAVPANRFRARKPLVFMNACTTSGTTELYTELASWADRFLRCGSGAFIGTLWEVRDSSAREFADAFYDGLVDGRTLGEAMQAARAKLRALNPGDPTPLAYTLYGNPQARMVP